MKKRLLRLLKVLVSIDGILEVDYLMNDFQIRSIELIDNQRDFIIYGDSLYFLTSDELFDDEIETLIKELEKILLN